jgi:hypothetical protein
VRCGCRKEAGWVGKRNGEHGARCSSSQICEAIHPSNSLSLGKPKNAIDPIVDEDYTECSCDETGICPCAVPRNDSSSLQSPGSSHTRNCHGPTDGRPTTSQSSCCPSQAETPINYRCNSLLSPLNSTDHSPLSFTSGLPDGVRRRRNSAPPACVCPVVQSPYSHPAASNSTHSCCNPPPLTVPPSVTEPRSFLDGVHTPSNSYTSPYTDSMWNIDPLFNASPPINPSHGALRAESSGQAPRFAPYPNHSHSQGLRSNCSLPQQQFLRHPPAISALHAQTNSSDIAAPQSIDLVTPVTQNTNPATIGEFLAPIPTRTSPTASNGNAQYTATSSGTVFAAPIEPVVSNCSCSGSCSCVLCSGSNLETVLMSASLGTEPDNCQRCNDCFDCTSLLNDLPQLAPLRDASIAALSAFRTVPAPQSGLQSQTDVQRQLDTHPSSTLQLDWHNEVSPSWAAAPDPDILSLLHSNPLFAPSEAELANSAWSNYLLSAQLNNVGSMNGDSDQLAPTQAQSGEAPVTQGPSFNEPVDDTYHHAF